MTRHPLLVLALAAVFPASVPAQNITDPSSDPTVLKQIILFGRHGVRSAAVPASTLAGFTTRSYPDFGVPPGYLTSNGAKAEVLLGKYFRAYLTSQGLLTGDDAADARKSYFRANSIQRSNISAASLASGIFNGVSIPVYSYPLNTPDPVFDPISARLVTVDAQRAALETAGIYNGAALASALSAEFALIRSALYNYALGTTPPPPPPAGVLDPTSLPIPLTTNTSNVATANVMNVGGLQTTLLAADPFVMEYTNGMPMADVAWGQLSLAQISQQTRIITADFAVEMSSPYLNQLQSSNAAAHVLRTMDQIVSGHKVAGAFSAPDANVVVINSSDAYVVGLASLLKMHWWLPGYQQDYCPPGGNLVFELRQDQNSNEYIVRVYFTAQTFDQIRNLTPLAADTPPATMQLLVPGGSHSPMSLDVPFQRFKKLLNGAINFDFVQDPSLETPPAPLTGVPLS